jgi:hypothetical protein
LFSWSGRITNTYTLANSLTVPERIRKHAGSINDPSFTRHEQGEYERREPLG